MKIAILGAMDEEVALLKSSLQDISTHQVQHLEVYQGTLHGHDTVLVKCGIGKVAAATATALLIHHFAPDAVINTGSAGGFDNLLNIGDVVIGTEVTHHDVDVTHFGYKLGQAPGQPEKYQSAPALVAAASEAAGQIADIQITQGLVCTGDSFIGTDEQAELIRHNFAGLKAAEMEAAAIAQCCHMLSVPFLIIRSLSDIAGKTSTMSFEAYLEKAAVNSANLVMGTIQKL
mgnify:CR=1 FL=1